MTKGCRQSGVAFSGSVIGSRLQVNYSSLRDLLPHRDPMVLLRGILSHDHAQTVCQVHFTPADAVLLGDGVSLPAAFALELIAQTMAVHDGLRRQTEQRSDATGGLLLGSRRFDLFCHRLPVGHDLRVVARGEDAAGGGLVRFEGHLETWEGTLLAAGAVTVLEQRKGSGS